VRYGIISDIHGNLEALETVIKELKAARIDSIFCAGDIVGYGANPKTCLDMIRDLKTVCVAGNHDWAVSGKFNPAGFNEVALRAVEWTRGQLTSEDLTYINSLGLVHKENGLTMVHGTLSEPEHFHYMVYLTDAEETMNLMDGFVCFIGHTHAPQIIVQEENEVKCLNELKVNMDPERKYLVNVGSVGQPRDGNPKAAYCIYDSENRSAEIRRTAYDVAKAQNKIIGAGLPEVLAERLAVGR